MNGEGIPHSKPNSSGYGGKFWSSGSLSRSEKWPGNPGNIGGEKAERQMKNKTRRKKTIGREGGGMTREGKKMNN